ncbi:MAG TPA: FimV/HubP family polar landmark protein [Noviherbaspirillum sp.]
MPSNMHSNKRPKSGSFNLKTLSAAVASALLFSNAYAAGLGKLTVLSALGQPLRAEIELSSVSKDEVGALTAKLASAEAFKQAGIDLNPALMGLQFSVQQRGDRQFIRVTSPHAMNEPFVDMLLELAGPNGRLVREYTFLLDPADLRTTQSAQVAPAPVPERAAQAPVQSQAVPQTSAPAARPTPQVRPADVAPRAERPAAPAAGMAGAPGEYHVRNGDSLAKIANQVRSGGVSLDQMLVALYQNNPDAFIGNNMNRLKAGQILTVPTAEAAQSVPQAEARSIVVAQAADFNAYRKKLADQVAASAGQKSAETRQSAGGRITAKVEERPTPASESKDKLKLSAAQAAAGGAAAKAPAVTAEDKIAAEKALAEANARVKELEKNVSELQKLLEVKNKALAEQQKQADVAKSDGAGSEAAKAEAAKAEAAKAEAAKAEAAKAEAAKQQAAATDATAEKAATPPAPPVAPAQTAPQAKTVAPPPPPPAPEPSFVDELMENPLVLPGLGALLVALGALGIYRARRQKQSKHFEDSIISDSSLKANSLFGSTGGQSVDTNNSVFNSSFSPSASQLDTNEVDPVAEADVYIAYGRDAQAEEILKEALRTQPDRQAVRLKLLEIYSNRKDLRAFEVLATELYGMTKGEGDDWAQAATMGAAIDPNNPLYASGKKEGGDSSGVLAAPTQPLDEQGLATLLSTTQPDTTALETIGPLDTDASYFGNTAMATETPLEPVPEAEVDAEPKAEEHQLSSNDLDFDLDGMQDMAVPNTIPRPAPAEPPAELASIDFDFLDEPKAKAEEPAVTESEPTPEPDVLAELAPPPQLESNEAPASLDQGLDFSLEDKPTEQPASDDLSLDIGLPAAEEKPLDISIPELDEVPAAEAKPEAANPMDFDLSDISLELSPPTSDAGEQQVLPESETGPSADVSETDAVPDLDFAAQNEFAAEDSASNSAEMATKLDLAIAYQEIGDKEGARELLDEVLKGGTPEQSERAKSLLLELA